MLFTLIAFLLLASKSQAETCNCTCDSSSPSTSILYDSLSDDVITDSLLFDVNEELEKISKSCFTVKDHEELTGNTLRYKFAEYVTGRSVPAAVETIGLEELRANMKFGPVRPWGEYYNYHSYSDRKAATTPEAYYNIKEPISIDRSLDSYRLVQENVNQAVKYLDKKFPAIRIIFSRKYEKLRRSQKKDADRVVVDEMISEFKTVKEKITEAIDKMPQTTAIDKECVKKPEKKG